MKIDIKSLWNRLPLSQWSGIELIEYSEGYAKMCLQVEDHHRGGGGSSAVNGAIVAYMFDGLLGACALTTWDSDTIGQVTVSLNIQYMALVKAKKQVLGTSKVIKRGKSTVFMEGEIFDEEENLCVKCHGIYRLRKKN